MHEINVGGIAILKDREDIDVVKHGCHDGRFRAVILDHLIFLFHRLRLLEAPLGGQLLHLLVKVFADLRDVSLQDLFYLRDILLVFLQALQTLAWSFATLDVIFEADLVAALRDALGRQRIFTGPDRIKLLEHLKHHLCRKDGRVGTIILGTVADNIPGLEDTREILVLDDDRGIGLVVFQQDVVTRTVLLDQVVLEQKRVLFGVHDDVFDVADLLDENPGLVVVVLLVEIGGDPSLQVLRLADVDDRSLLVVVLVRSRLLRDRGEYRL